VGTLALSAAGLVGLVLQEGYTDRAVQPLPGDKWTVGFGTTGGVKPGDRITPPKALARALTDVQAFEGALKACVTVPLSQVEYDEYLGFSYNVGSSAFCNSTMVRRLNAKDYTGACNEFSRWTMFQGRDCRIAANRCGGLVKRRAEAQAACLGAQ
jgi:lysozyme